MEAMWETQMPPRTPPELQQPEHVESLYCWWLIDGMRHQPSVPFIFDEVYLQILGESISTPSGSILPLWLYRYWQSLPRLQEIFSLTDCDSVADLLVWSYGGGNISSELLCGLPIAPETLAFLHRDAAGCAFPVPRALKALWNCNIQGAKMYDISTPTGCAALILWFLAYQNAILPHLPIHLKASLADVLLRRSNKEIPLVAEATLLVRPDAQPYFMSLPPSEYLRFYYWIFNDFFKNQQDHPLVSRMFTKLFSPNGKLEPDKPAVYPRNPEQENYIHLYIHSQRTADADSTFGSTESGGINIVGLAKGELGLGEDVRMAASACKKMHIPFGVYNPPFAIASRQEDMTVQNLLIDTPRYALNLVFLPGIETLRLFFNDGLRLFKERYTIGAWQWELPNWPQALERALPLAQEFWLSSRFTTEVMRNATTSPVFFMPMTVELPDFISMKRAAHNLPDDVFIFLYIFDGLSWGSRKNPMAAIRAFQAAFSKSDDVRLVIKTMNATVDMPFWKAILEAQVRDKRILCINETYTKPQLLSLFACCDAYVSLHRAEGFGRTIAEAMLLEKPVIATAWSGNADFTTPQTAFAIGGRLVPVCEGEYIFWEGQEWCEPDHDAAVSAMQECVANPTLASAKAKAGRQLILEQYSACAVGLRYRQRLEMLGVL